MEAQKETNRLRLMAGTMEGPRQRGATLCRYLYKHTYITLHKWAKFVFYVKINYFVTFLANLFPPVAELRGFFSCLKAAVGTNFAVGTKCQDSSCLVYQN